MYRRYTTTGTNNLPEVFGEAVLVLLCLAFLFFVRFSYLNCGQTPIADDYGYYQASMIQEKEAGPVFSSGVSYAYCTALSALLRFTGNRMEMTACCHMALQAVSILLLYFGYRIFFGKAAALLSLLSFALLPWSASGVFVVSPENFYLFVWSLICLILGLLSRRDGWLCAFAAGLFAGVACIWHGLGFCLLLLLLFSENDRLKKLVSFAAGMALGAGFELVRYRELAGLSFGETLYGWGNSLIRYEEGRWQDMDTWLPIWLLATLLTGALIRSVRETRFEKAKEKEQAAAERQSVQEEIMENTQDMEAPEAADDVRQKQEGVLRKIHYIENPLPLPKKHRKRTMEFQLDCSGASGKEDDFDRVSRFDKSDDFYRADDFDVEIGETDDFDI